MSLLTGESLPASASRPCSSTAPWYRGADSYRLDLRAQQFRQAFEVEDPADQVRLLADAMEPASAEAPQAVPVLALPEELLDLLPTPLRQPVAEAPHALAHARVGPAAPAPVPRRAPRRRRARQRA